MLTCFILNVFLQKLLQQLKGLRINRCKLSFWPKFEKLQVLKFSLDGAEDSFLHVIGTYCPDLRYYIFFFK